MTRGPSDTPDRSTSARPPTLWLVLAAVLVIQALLQAYFFPLSDLLGAKPLYYIDSPFHQYQMELARDLCQQGRLVGYDPFFAAGQLGGVTFNASAKFPALMACIAGSPEAVVPAYKLFSFAMGLLSPLAPVFAVRMLGWSKSAAWAVGGFSLLLWWTGPLRWYHTAGLVSYVAVAYWTIPFAVAFSRTCESGRVLHIVGVAAMAALGLFVHPLFVVAATLLCAPLVLSDLHRHGGIWRVAAVAVAVVAVAGMVNWPWLQATINLPNIASSQPYQRLVDPLLIIEEPLAIARTASGGSHLYLALIIGAIAAACLATARERSGILALVAASLLLMGWASFGALSPAIAALQPNRFSTMAWLVLALPAAHGAAALATAWKGSESHRAQQATLAAGMLAMAAISIFYTRELILEVFSARTARYAVPRPEVKGEGATSTQLTEWIRTHTDAGARIMFENSLGRVHDGAHIAGLLALRTQREFIGGPYPFTDFASTWDDVAFNRPFAAMTATELSGYLDLYNVKWMLCHSASCRAAMASLPSVSAVATIGPVMAFERRMEPTYFIAGSGAIRTRCFNRLDIETSGAGPLVLKYHWAPGLSTTPPMDIGKQYVAGDPRPFISIDRPAPRFAIGFGQPRAACGPAKPSNRGM